ncbi:MAG: response regulator transcription factor [Lachnospiraceae bacterium]|nr:response regulator transcription factor [Lachnospiraceae bacterium]
MKYKILVADDENEIRELLRLYLENEGYEVVEASDGREALDKLDKEKPDMCILDIMMPETDGYRVLKTLREKTDGGNIPVIILSAKDADSEKILGLDLGADDYISKPFNPLEAVARVNSQIRRFYRLGSKEMQDDEKKQIIQVGDLMLDTESCTLKRGTENIEITPTEYRIMELFMLHPGKVFTKQQIYEYAWGDDYIISDNNIMVGISKLRNKLSEEPSKYIKTLRGLGYRLDKADVQG